MKLRLILFCVVISYTNLSFAAGPVSNSKGVKKLPEWSLEQRQKMAIIHEKHAQCLRSDRPIEECRKEMRESCNGRICEDGLHMMMGGRRHHHMKNGMK